MASTINKGLYCAFATLQMNRETIALKVNNHTVKAMNGTGDWEEEYCLPQYTRQDVANHCHGDSCWLILNNNIYDVTEFLRLHPGGEDIILEYGGHDATTAFIDKGHSVDAVNMLKEYIIGFVVKEDWLPEVDFK